MKKIFLIISIFISIVSFADDLPSKVSVCHDFLNPLHSEAKEGLFEESYKDCIYSDADALQVASCTFASNTRQPQRFLFEPEVFRRCLESGKSPKMIGVCSESTTAPDFNLSKFYDSSFYECINSDVSTAKVEACRSSVVAKIYSKGLKFHETAFNLCINSMADINQIHSCGEVAIVDYGMRGSTFDEGEYSKCISSFGVKPNRNRVVEFVDNDKVDHLYGCKEASYVSGRVFGLRWNKNIFSFCIEDTHHLELVKSCVEKSTQKGGFFGDSFDQDKFDMCLEES